MAHSEACQLYIEQEIEASLNRGKSAYAIGKDLSAWVNKLFDARIPANTIEVRARRIKNNLRTNVRSVTTRKQKASAYGLVTDFNELIGGNFGCVYADPPWKYDNQGTRAATDNHYPTLSVEEIIELHPVSKIVAEKAHLHLWTTNAFLEDSFKVIRAWGFEFKSTFVWVKEQMGIGNYWRNSHEIMLTATRGGQVAISKSEKSWLLCKRGRHSSKPEKVRLNIEKLSPGPYVELFGRRKVEGWTVFGNEVEDELI